MKHLIFIFCLFVGLGMGTVLWDAGTVLASHLLAGTPEPSPCPKEPSPCPTIEPSPSPTVPLYINKFSQQSNLKLFADIQKMRKQPGMSENGFFTMQDTNGNNMPQLNSHLNEKINHLCGYVNFYNTQIENVILFLTHTHAKPDFIFSELVNGGVQILTVDGNLPDLFVLRGNNDILAGITETTIFATSPALLNYIPKLELTESETLTMESKIPEVSCKTEQTIICGEYFPDETDSKYFGNFFLTPETGVVSFINFNIETSTTEININSTITLKNDLQAKLLKNKLTKKQNEISQKLNKPLNTFFSDNMNIYKQNNSVKINIAFDKDQIMTVFFTPESCSKIKCDENCEILSEKLLPNENCPNIEPCKNKGLYMWMNEENKAVCSYHKNADVPISLNFPFFIKFIELFR